MSQLGRNVKNLEAPRPLKTTSRQSHAHTQLYEVQSIEELITLTENVAAALSNGSNNSEGMSVLLANLRLHGPQLEIISKDTLDRAFVTFRNASQDERLNIMTRLNLLELIELRAKSWQLSDGINSYYKHKVANVEPDPMSLSTMSDTSLLSTSPTATALGQSSAPLLAPGEIIRTSGKFPKPTKIPGKNYSKDEVVIRNADSGKVMGIKGRRVHMIEELSETIISFQRVNPGAKERLVQITGPNEEKINYAKQLIEETIRRNASPTRLDATQGGSCSSLASSASDETAPKPNRNSIGAIITSASSSAITNNYVPNNQAGMNSSINQKLSRNSAGTAGGGQLLLHSFSTNDASLGEYKYTVNIGQHNVKITGDCFDLVRVAKLVLDDYFSSNDFLASVEVGAAFDSIQSMMNPGSLSGPATPLISAPSIIPPSHQLLSSSPFVDSGINLDLMAQNAGNSSGKNGILRNSCEIDDEVFIDNVNQSNTNTPSSTDSSSTSSTSNTTLVTSTPVNGLSRSRRSHFSRKDSTPEDKSKETANKEEQTVRVVHEYERLIYYSKSPHSWVLPRDWAKICDQHPSLVRNKDVEDEKTRFDADKHMAQVKSGGYINIICANEGPSESPDPE